MGNNGPWVRVPYEKKNELEKEIDSYEQVIFPPRPAGLEGGHEEMVAERERRRRERVHFIITTVIKIKYSSFTDITSPRVDCT